MSIKAIFRIDKQGRFDSFIYHGDKVPPFIPPPKRDEPKDGAPPEPAKDDKLKPS